MAKIIEGNNLPFEDALNNRIALSIMGIGLNELTNPVSSKEKIKNLKAVINSPRYKSAYSALELKYFPIHWKVVYDRGQKGYNLKRGKAYLQKLYDDLASK